MIKFKAWDWVRDTRQGMKKPITQLKPNCIALTNPEEYAIYYIPWAPEVGEWVWCRNGYDSAYIIQYKIVNYDIECEPFIGELPSFLKDKK